MTPPVVPIFVLCLIAGMDVPFIQSDDTYVDLLDPDCCLVASHARTSLVGSVTQ